MSPRIIVLTLSILLAFPALALSFQGFIQSFDEGGSITWGNGGISVVRILDAPTGDSEKKLTPLSVRLAATQARKQMLDILMSIRIDGKRTVRAYLSEDDELAAGVRGVILNSPLERPSLFEGGGEVKASEQLRGKLAELILPTTLQFQTGLPPRLSTSMDKSMSYIDSAPEETGVATSGYTGVIIDASGLQVTPALAPVIYGQDGAGAYGAFLVSRANAIDKGIVAYATTNSPAALKERVGTRPLIVRALSVYGSWRTDLIISSPMARMVRALMRAGDAVDNCRVVIVLDATKPMEIAGGEESENVEEPVKEQ